MDTINFKDGEKLSDTIALIYDSAHNPELWPELLNHLDETIYQAHLTDGASDTTVVAESSAFIQLLRPHFQRALEFNKQIYALQAERNAVSDILDRLPIGVILVDNALEPAAMNTHARLLIESGQCLSIRDGKLTCTSAKHAKQLHSLIAEAVVHSQPLATEKGKTLLLSNGSGEVCSLHILPSAHANIDADKKLAAVFIASSNIHQDISTETLSDLYGLTSAESRLVKNLLNGSHSLTEAAEALGVSKHTVRSQVKSILEKTGTHSQAELIKKVLASPAALIGEKQSSLPIQDIAALESVSRLAAEKNNPFKTIKLFDGRCLEYREYGDPHGQPVVFLHSCVHSRKAPHPSSTMIEESGIRLIAPERPGFGETSLLPDGHAEHLYAQDIGQLLDHLDIKQAYLLSDTSGAMFGLVCCRFAPERFIRHAIVTYYPEPRFDDQTNILRGERLALKTYQTMPRIFLTHLAKIIIGGISKNPDNYFGRIKEQLPLADQSITQSREHRAIFAEAIRNAYPDKLKGYIDDFMQRLTPYSFDVGDINVPTQIWHGSANNFVDIISAKKLHQSMPKSELIVLEDQGHYIIISHWDEILNKLVDD